MIWLIYVCLFFPILLLALLLHHSLKERKRRLQWEKRTASSWMRDYIMHYDWMLAEREKARKERVTE